MAGLVSLASDDGNGVVMGEVGKGMPRAGSGKGFVVKDGEGPRPGAPLNVAACPKHICFQLAHFC